MFIGITQLVQSPKTIIPSFVWLKRNHHIKDFFRDLFAFPLPQPFELNRVEVPNMKGIDESDHDPLMLLVFEQTCHLSWRTETQITTNKLPLSFHGFLLGDVCWSSHS